jgi:hypothetical protein
MGYIYQADTYCDVCGERLCSSLRGTHPSLCPEDEMDTRSYDSDDFPKPYDHRHDESDVPEHCAQCQVMLHNPLTVAGYRYVQGQLNQFPNLSSVGKLVRAGYETLAEWAGWYGFTYWDAEDCEDAMRDDRPAPGWYSDEMVGVSA